MKISSEIVKVISDDLKAFKKEFKKSNKGNISLLNIVTKFVLKHKEERIRSILVFLSAKLCGNTNKSTHTAASLIELLHSATLVHNDVSNKSHIKRSLFSIKSIWKSKIAVLLGDYLLAQGLGLAVKNKEYRMLKITSAAIKEISEGELLEVQSINSLDLSKEVYFELITKKTASLLSACSECGASSATKDISKIHKLKEFGHYLGMTYQMKEDLHIYEKPSLLNKSKGKNINILSLPLIHALEKSNQNKQTDILSRLHGNNSDRTIYSEVLNLVHEQNGIEYTLEKIRESQNKALESLLEFPDSEIKNALKLLVLSIAQHQK